MANYYGDWVSTAGGKFRLKITTSYTTAGIVWTPIIDVNNAFDKAQKFELKYTNASGDAKSYKKLANGNTTCKSVNEFKFTAKTWPNYKITKKISLVINGKTSSIAANTIVSSNKPPAPSISVKHPVASRFEVTVSGNGSTSQPVQKIYLERAETASPATSDWQEIKYQTVSSVKDGATYSYTFQDTDVDEGAVYKYRARVSGSASGSEIFSSYVVDSGTYYTNPGQGDTPDTDEQGSSIVINWSASISEIDAGVVQGFYVMRSTDGGPYVRIATVMASSSRSQYSYTDSSRVNGHTYKYAIQPFGSGGIAPTPTPGGDEYQTAPNAPTRVNVYRNAQDNVIIDIYGSSSVAENVHIERSIDGSGWGQIAEEDYPLDTYTDTTATASDSIQYRVRYSNGKGYSSYAYSNTVQIKQPPNPPTLTGPLDGAVIPLDDGTVRLTFKHNPTDGSPQTQACVAYKVGSLPWVYQYVGVNSYYSLSLAGLSPNESIIWKVRTKGSHEDYSQYSEEYHFTVLSKPELAITAPLNNAVIVSLPISLSFSYSDLSGTLKELYVDVMQKDILKTFEFDTGSGESGSYTYSLKEFLFENENSYSLRVRALSSSGLWATDIISITVEYADVSLSGGLLPIVTSDPETGYAYITVLRDITEDDEGDTPEPVPIQEAYLYRVHKRQRELVSEAYEGIQITDKYAPLNVEYFYELLMLTTSGQVSIVKVSTECDSRYAMIYYGDNLDKIARIMYSPSAIIGLKRPDKKRVQYSGRELEVSYDSKAIRETADFKAVTFEYEEYLNFDEMMRLGGQGIWKSLSGDSYYADFDELSVEEPQSYITDKWKVSLSIVRIERPADD